MEFEKLNATSCRVSDIQNGDVITIGGSSSFADVFDLKVTADIEKFEPFFQIVEKKALEFQNSDRMKAFFQQIAPGFDVKTLAHIYAFDNLLRRVYPDLSANKSERQGFYDTAGTKMLSQAFQEGVCQCAEMAILAQAYLQRQGLETRYFGGAVFSSSNAEYSEPHSFISLKTENGDDFFYDPANAHFQPKSGKYLPKISSITPAQKKQFENRIHIQIDETEYRKCVFLEARDIMTKESWYYGCGDDGEIDPSFIISKNNLRLPITKENSL